MLLKLITFICGASVMILELAGMRIITPFLGSSFIVWTCTIGIIMISLSIGYYLGGKFSDKNPTEIKLSFFITLAALYILIIGAVGFKFLECISSDLGSNLYFISIFSALIIFTVPSIFLGMVSPYVIKIALDKNNTSDSGNIIGQLYAISTIGSIFGTFLSGFFLIIFFGVDTILFALSSILAFASLLLVINKFNKRINLILLTAQFLILAFSFFFIYIYKLNNKQLFDNAVYSKTTPYQYVWISKTFYSAINSNILCLTSYKWWCHSTKVENDINNESLFNYVQLFYKFYELKNKKNNILMLGGAGCTLASKILSKSYNNINFDIVEIDKDTKDIATKYFNIPDDKRLHFYFEDARTFLNRESKKHNKTYDIIYFDIFKEDLIPFNLLTQESFTNIKNLMNNNAILCINIAINKKKFDGIEYLNQIYTQLKSVFPEVRCYSEYKIEPNQQIYNIVICAFKNSTDINSLEIKQTMEENEYKDVNITNKLFTDKYAPIEKFEIYNIQH